MQDHLSDTLNNLGCGLIEGRLSFNDFPDNLLDEPDLYIGNKAPAYLYCAVWCFTKALMTATEPEKTKNIQNNLEKANSLMTDFIEKTSHIPRIDPPAPRRLSRFETKSGYNPGFQYPTTPPQATGDRPKNIAKLREYR